MEIVPIVITHDMAPYTLAGLEQAGIEVHDTFDIRAVNMEESPIEADDAWARAAELYNTLVPDAVPYVVMVDATRGREVEAICARVLGALDEDINQELLPHI